MTRFFIILFSVAFVFMTSATAANANNKYASLVMDADTGMILSQRNADKSLHPASLTKMMTLLLTFEALDSGVINKKERVRISNRAASMVPSKIGLPAGSSIRVEDAIYALVTKSANDIAVALAEHIGGSEYKFANLMTARARTIGMSKTTFKNASGLHHSAQVSTARDMGKLARYLLQRYPHHYRYFSTKSFTYKGKTYRNHNRLMTTYRGMDGFKTGYINASGFNLVASAYRDGRRLIGVVFGGRSSKTRNDHMAEIMDEGFKKAGRVRFALAKPPIPPVKPISGNAIAQNTNANTQNASFISLSALNSNKTKIVTAKPLGPNYTELSKALQSGAFGEMIGEGDIDPAVSKRLETGLIAVAVHKGDYKPNPAPASAVENSLRDMGHRAISQIGADKPIKPVQSTNISTLPHPKETIGRWSIQIGAFNSRAASDDALRSAKEGLPPSLKQASPMVVPLRTADGLIFRARLGNLSQSEASLACRYINDCMPIAPISTRISGQ